MRSSTSLAQRFARLSNYLQLGNAAPIVVIWLPALVLTPVVGWLVGQGGLVGMSYLGVVLQTAAALTLLLTTWPTSRLLRTVAIIMPITWAAEWLGSSTGIPFGAYHYTSVLRPQILGVPLLIPFAWLMMLPPAWGISSGLIAPRHRLRFALLAGLVFTAWDLFLDPQMVANGLWVWDQPGAYFGIPVANFVGWWCVASLVTYLCHPNELPRRPLAAIYTLVTLLESIALGIFWGQPLPALAGLTGMGLFVTLFWIREQTSVSNDPG
jgi:putative membrane protein